MNQRLTIIFFVTAVAFVAAHALAVYFSLYWYFWWADTVMHSWGGILIGLGVLVLAQLPHLPVRATLSWLLGFLFITTVSWELFERYYGLYNPTGYPLDTTLDITLGFVGGLLIYLLFYQR